MKRIWKIFWICFAVTASLALKAYYTYEIYVDGYHFDVIGKTFFGISAEHFIYIIDALTVLILFGVVVAKLKKPMAKAALLVGSSIGYTLSVMVCNYCWQSLEWNVMFSWQSPILTPLYFARRGLERYFKTGTPAFHFAFGSMLALCAIVSVWQGIREPVSIFLKNKLLKRAQSCEKGKKKLFYYEIILTHLKQYLTEDEFEAVRNDFMDTLTVLEEKRKGRLTYSEGDEE